MKKRMVKLNSLIIVVLGLFLVSSFSVFAEINIDSLSRTTFNYGDKFLVSGNIKYVEDVRGFLSLSLVCGNTSNVLYTGLVDLKQGVGQSFSHLVTVPNKIGGSCYLEGKLLRGTEAIDSIMVPGITVTEMLEGNFDINIKQTSQLGDSFVLSASIIKNDKSAVDGSAMVYFKQGDNILIVDSADVVGGQLSYEKDLGLMPPGQYTVDLEVQDNQGNSRYFSYVAGFELIDRLTVEAVVDRVLYNPGEVAIISGSVKSPTGSLLKNLNVEAVVEGNVLSQELPDSDSGFELKYSIPEDIKSGEHPVQVIVKDENGNYGVAMVKFNVKSIPKTISIALNKTEFIPGEAVIFRTNVFDQAGDFYDDNVFVKLFNEKGDFEKSKLVPSNGYSFMLIPIFTLPSNGWKITVEGLDLSDGKMIKILPYKAITTELQNGVLSVTNVGNVVYDDFVDVQAGNIVKGKKIYLDLNESTTLNLATIFDAGNYSKVGVVTTGQNFSDVSIVKDDGFLSGLATVTGGAVANAASNLKSGSKSLLFLLFVALVVSLIFIFKPVKKEVYTEEQRTKDVKAGQVMLERLRAKGIRKGPIKNNYEYPEMGRASEQERNDFAQRMARQVKDEEERIAKENFSNRWSGQARDLENYSTSGAFDKSEKAYGSQTYQRINSNENSNLPFEKKQENVKVEEEKKDSGYPGGLINW